MPAHGATTRVRPYILRRYWTDNVTRGIRSVLSEQAGEVELIFEFMDVKRLYTDEYLHQLRDLYRRKYAGRKIDVIITSDDHALNFLLGLGRDLFPNVPIVFCAVNGYDPVQHRGDGRPLTGVVETIDIKATLDIALQLHPETKEVAVITDRTLTGRALKAEAEEVFRDYEDRVRFKYLEHLTMDQLQREVSALSDETIVFAFIFSQDKFGRVFSHEYNLQRLAAHCQIPIYSVWEFHLGHGIVGGMLTSGRAHGQTAAQMALRILRGENASNIPIVLDSPNRYMFDDNQLRRFDIKQSSLPEGTVVINKPASIYEEYKPIIWSVVAVIFVLSFLVVILVANVAQRKRADQLLQALNQAALAMSKALKPEEIFTAVAAEFKNLGIFCVVFLTDESQNNLLPKYLSHETGAVRAAEKLTGLKANDFPIPIETVDVFRKVVRGREALFVDDVEAVTRQVLPGPLNKFAGQIVRMLKVPKFISAPLVVEDEVIGMLSVQSDDLSAEDIPAITAFAHQMAAAWRKAQLFEQAQQEIVERMRAEQQIKASL